MVFNFNNASLIFLPGLISFSFFYESMSFCIFPLNITCLESSALSSSRLCDMSGKIF